MITKTAAELADLCGADLEGDGARAIRGPASLASAAADEISFLANPRYRGELALTRAGAVLVAGDVAAPRPDLTLLRVRDPNRAFTEVVRAFAVPDAPGPHGIHPSAVVAPSAVLGPGVSIGPHAFVDEGVRVGAGALLGAGVVLGAGAEVGERTTLHPHVVVYPRVSIGSDCTIHAGTVLGSDGFGFEPGPEGWVKIPQCGTVHVEDDVEIGANVTVDRARFGVTRIGRGAKIDNLCHVAHNVEIGERVLLVAQVGIAGSSRIERNAVLGGQVGVAGHVTIGPGARVAGGSGVFGDLAGGADYLGFPARPRREALRALALQQKLPELLERVRALEQRLADPAGGGAS